MLLSLTAVNLSQYVCIKSSRCTPSIYALLKKIKRIIFHIQTFPIQLTASATSTELWVLHCICKPKWQIIRGDLPASLIKTGGIKQLHNPVFLETKMSV